MTSVLLQPKAWGLDAASFRRFTDFQRVVDAGATWVSLYVDGDNGVNRTVVEAAWAHGLPVMLNFELYEQAAKYGYSQGVAHAQRAMPAAQALGFQGEAPLIFSGADFNPTAAQLPAVLDYHRALVDTYTLGPGGAYGPRSVLEPLSRQPWWPDDWPLWHWGGDGSTQYPWAWVKQGPGGSYFNPTVGFNVDNNLTLKPMSFWSGYGEDRLDPDQQPTPPRRDLDMPAIFRPTDDYHWPGDATLPEADYPSTAPHVFLIDAGGALRHITAAEYTVYLNQGVTPVAVTGPQMKEMLDTAGVYRPPTASTLTGTASVVVDLHTS